jgi:hypothetical protein
MPLYTGPEGLSLFASPYIRIERRVYVRNPKHDEPHPEVLARSDGILEELMQLKIRSPLSVDVGRILIANDLPEYGGKQIIISPANQDLVPDLWIARAQTIIDVSRQSPGYNVRHTKLFAFDLYSLPRRGREAGGSPN